MRSTKKKAVESKGIIYAQGRIWSGDQLKNYRNYQNNYRKEHYRAFAIRFNRDSDEDVIEYLEKQESLTDTIRQLVRLYGDKIKTQD